MTQGLGSRPQVSAEIKRLPREDQEAISNAVANGRAVEDDRLAPLAASWAAARRRQAALLCFGILAPLYLLTWAVIGWLVERDDPQDGELAVLVGGWAIIGIISLPIRLLVWRPLVRAEKANMARKGAVAPQATRVVSAWFQAWGLAFIITSIIGLVLIPLGVSLGPLGFAPWWALTLIIYRASSNHGPGD